MQCLVNTPDAEAFIMSTQIESGLKIAAGDPKVDAYVGPDIVSAQIALKEGAKKVMALAQDPTRNDVQRHEVAKKIATEVEAKLTSATVAIENRAKQLRESAMEEAELILGPKPARAAIESELRLWVKEQQKKDSGLEHIKAAMKESAELAGVLFSSPRFLLGLSANMADKLKFEAVELHAPEQFAKLSNAVGLMSMAERCKGTVRKVRSSFYSPALADAASKRVQV